MRGLENQHQVSNKERMTKLRLLNLKNARHRRSIIKAFRYIKAWWKETRNKLSSISLVDMERSKLKQGRSKSETKENSLTQLSRFFLSRSILQFSSPQTTTLTAIERVCTGLEILCGCLRQHCYPEKQVANYTLRNLFHNTPIQQWSYLPKFPFPYCSVWCRLLCRCNCCRAAPCTSTVKWANLKTTLVLEGLF